MDLRPDFGPIDPLEFVLAETNAVASNDDDRVVSERYVLQAREGAFWVASAHSPRSYEFASAGMDAAAISIEAIEVVMDYIFLWEYTVNPSDREPQSFRDALTEAQEYFAAVDGLVDGTHH